MLLILAALAAPSVAEACTVTTSGLAFGSYDPFDPRPTDSTAVISVDCATPYTIELDAGQAGSFDPRALSSGEDVLEYNIFTSSSFSAIVGDGTGGTQTISGPGSSQPTDHVVHGRIFPQQNRTVGSYSDVLIVTILF
jgi:spore coat protein U-like protein